MKKINLILLVLSLVLLIASCKKKDTQLTPPAIMTVVGISPTHGPHSTVVTITGTHFSMVAAENIVKFNGVIAEVTGATSATLTVKVPKRSGTGKVTVTKNNTTVDGPAFEYEFTVNVSTVAGGPQIGMVDGNGLGASFSFPKQMVFDKDDNLFVIDQGGNAVRKITPAGDVTTYAGTHTYGNVDGIGTAARFFGLTDICYDKNNNTLYVTEYAGNNTGSNRIRKITPSGAVGATTLIAGSRHPSTAGGNLWGYENNTNIALAKFKGPVGCAVDNNSNLYVLDLNNYAIRKISFTGEGVTTVAGDPGQTGFIDGTGAAARFGSFSDVIINGNALYIADATNFRIRKAEFTGQVTTFTGNGINIDADGPLATATFRRSDFVTADKDGNYFVVSGVNQNTIRFITKEGRVLTITKTDEGGYENGAPDVARFRSIKGMAVNSRNELYVSDWVNSRIRKVVVE